jgi:hypothetical protein
MTTRGGKRDGSGRPQGAINKLSRAAIRRAMARGEEMPLDFMLKYMRGEPVEQKVTVNGKEKMIRKPLPIEARLKLAEACAPYLHHRLSAIENLPSKQSDPEPDGEGGDHELPDFRRPN